MIQIRKFTRTGGTVSYFGVSNPDIAQNPFIGDSNITYTTKIGTFKELVTTKSDLTSVFGLRAFASIRPGETVDIEARIMLVEGDWTNKPLEFDY